MGWAESAGFSASGRSALDLRLTGMGSERVSQIKHSRPTSPPVSFTFSHERARQRPSQGFSPQHGERSPLPIRLASAARPPPSPIHPPPSFPQDAPGHEDGRLAPLNELLDEGASELPDRARRPRGLPCAGSWWATQGGLAGG